MEVKVESVKDYFDDEGKVKLRVVQIIPKQQPLYPTDSRIWEFEFYPTTPTIGIRNFPLPTPETFEDLKAFILQLEKLLQKYQLTGEVNNKEQDNEVK